MAALAALFAAAVAFTAALVALFAAAAIVLFTSKGTVLFSAIAIVLFNKFVLFVDIAVSADKVVKWNIRTYRENSQVEANTIRIKYYVYFNFISIPLINFKFLIFILIF